VGANIIAMYPSTSLFIAIGQLAIVILVLFSYPLQVHPCRNCLDKVFHAGDVVTIPKPVTEGENDEAEEEGPEDDEHANAGMTLTKHTLLTAAIITGGFGVAYFVDDLQMGKCPIFSDVTEVADKYHQYFRLWGRQDLPPSRLYSQVYSTGR
jgi:hypothetical protein